MSELWRWFWRGAPRSTVVTNCISALVALGCVGWGLFLIIDGFRIGAPGMAASLAAVNFMFAGLNLFMIFRSRARVPR